ncbi:hypothetical protein [Segatella copri]|uniref:Uncharacterized protein n=1 Tax=Segatella copri TaxID=165179 RepID=A0A414YG96_9BACT|nr:hypothetical protein [Segatella copri]RHH85172.1 hypothetical protein DW192_00120 [Segatella copri]
MIDDKKIKAAANKHIETEYARYNSGKVEDEMICLRGKGSFKEGAKWAINEFLKDLWHQTNKEPEGYDEWILLHYSVGNYYSLAQVKDFKSWKGFVENMPIDGWLYVDDLFSKEGGNQ